MRSVFSRQTLAALVLLFVVISVPGAEVPTLARVCTAQNRRSWVSISGYCHVLDFYGRGPTDLPGLASGDVALKALTDEAAAIQTFGKSPFVKTDAGIQFALFDDYSVGVDLGEAHRDQCLAAFAALDLPASTPIHLKSGAYSIADLVSESLATFTLKQRELEWSAMAFAGYVPPRSAWTNRAGERITFSELVGKLLQTDLNAEKCAGTHVLEALIRIEKADRRSPVLDASTRERLTAHLASAVAEIAHKQHADGSWSRSWCDAVNDNPEPFTPFQMSFLVTGHLLEILNELDTPLRPSREVYTKAAQWIATSAGSPEIKPNGFWLCPFTHAAHGAREVLAP